MASEHDEERGGWVARWWPFVALCLVGASRWLLDDRWPDAGSTLVSRSAGCGTAALLTLAAAAWSHRRGKSVGPEESVWRNAFGGLLMLGGPAVALILLPRDIDSGALMIALSITPVAAGVASVALGDAGETLAGYLWPGLAAMAGMLLILPQPSLADPTADLAMVLAPVMTGVGAALLAHESRRTDASGQGSGAGSGAVASLSAAALVFGAAALARYGFAEVRVSFTVPAAVLDGLVAWLAVATVRRLGAMRFSANSSLVPFVVLLEGLVLMRPTLTKRLEIGLILLLIAGTTLLVRGGDDPDDADPSMLDLG
ncbi:hypothetical protein SAMN05421819_0584 [Bryocella elongata]|uniref:EamA-like transporter family protein n=1 Tax=Bryocella elongata TaxID=863522 RepID=A0A1H5TF34_9BACT|nr:hypothetical protein [Bryocella elongata]SEF61373.1 hypothetical protein SAMN05421819_0584 [Bryocella elongata]